MQIESVSFKNFKVLRDTALPLSRMTLLIGPNGSGKSTAFEGLEWLQQGASGPTGCNPAELRSIGSRGSDAADPPVVSANWAPVSIGRVSRVVLTPHFRVQHLGVVGTDADALSSALSRIRLYKFDARSLRAPFQLQPSWEVSREGVGLAVALDRLRDQYPERFERLNEELPRWFPEYDHVLFDTPSPGSRALALRLTTKAGRVPAEHLSEGTLLALGLLTLAHLPSPPTVVCMDEPDRGVHPRLLGNIHDALTRLAFPKEAGDERHPVQVVATTHSPYFLNLFKDHPEDVVIAERENGEAKFHRLVDRPDIKDLIADASLGEIWYSGVLGGVPSPR